MIDLAIRFFTFGADRFTQDWSVLGALVMVAFWATWFASIRLARHLRWWRDQRWSDRQQSFQDCDEDIVDDARMMR